MWRPIALVLVLGVGLTARCPADFVWVPDDYATIQEAIDDIQDGDTVMLRDGEYPGGISFRGKSITVRGANGAQRVTIRGAGPRGGSAVTFPPGPDPATLEGVTITGAHLGHPSAGGGVSVVGSCVMMKGVNVTFNSATVGGGVSVRGEGKLVTCDATTIERNSSTSHGGGVHVAPGSELIAKDSFITNNTSTGGDGGGVYLDGADGEFNNTAIAMNNGVNGGGIRSVSTDSFEFNGGHVLDNIAQENGGGIDVEVNEDGHAVIDDVNIERNEAEGDGGGVRNTGAGVLELIDTRVRGGRAHRGGGRYHAGPTRGRGNLTSGNIAEFGGGVAGVGTVLELEDECIEDNEANKNGSGILLEAGALEIIRSVLEGNVAGEDGGGIGMSSGSSLRAIETWCSGNRAQNGGGLFARDALSPGAGITSELVNCVFQDNVATQWGGAIFNWFGDLPVSGGLFTGNTAPYGGAIFNAEASPVIINATFNDNAASVEGGALYNTGGGAPTIMNSILWGDSPQEILNANGLPSVGFSDVQGGVPGAWDAGANIDADPLFVDAAGGDWRLASGSPAIDAARNDAVPASLVVDLDGNDRFTDDPDRDDCAQSPGDCGDAPVVDMGGYEKGPSCPADLDGSGDVGFSDLVRVLAAWGDSGGPEDIDGSGTVDFGDVVALLAAWGPCP